MPCASSGRSTRTGSGSLPTATTSLAISHPGAILSEGGYEADLSMVFYGHPTRFAPAIEDLIIQSVHALLPAPFDGPRNR